MRAYIEHDNPICDRPGFASIWEIEWRDSLLYFEAEAHDFVMVGLPWKKE